MNVALLTLIFGGLAAIASGFVAFPLLRGRGSEGKSHGLALAGGLMVAAIGLSAYAFLGRPQIALATMGTPRNDDYPALVATLARRMSERPNDLDGWSLLGRGYVALGNPAEGARAFARAAAIARDAGTPNLTALLVEYGEALIDANRQVTDEAEGIFKEALVQEPGSLIPRYYLGLARAERSDKEGALAYWEKLLADAPDNVPWRGQLIDQVAALKAETGSGAPNPMAMVAQLASRLESNPDDLEGWLRLIRAYSVLGDREKAGAALAKARSVFSQGEAKAALDAAARENSLN